MISFHLDQFSCHRVLREQITHLILVPSCEPVTCLTIVSSRPYPNGIHSYIIQFFKNLQHLSVENGDTLSLLNDCTLTTCSSSILDESDLALDILVKAIDKAGYTGKIKIDMDVAASEFFDEKDKPNYVRESVMMS